MDNACTCTKCRPTSPCYATEGALLSTHVEVNARIDALAARVAALSERLDPIHRLFATADSGGLAALRRRVAALEKAAASTLCPDCFVVVGPGHACSTEKAADPDAELRRLAEAVVLEWGRPDSVGKPGIGALRAYLRRSGAR